MHFPALFFVRAHRVLQQEMMHRVQAAANAAVLEADASIAHALAKITCVIGRSDSMRPAEARGLSSLPLLGVHRHRGQLRSRATSFLATKATDKRRVSSFKVHVPLVDVPGSAAGASIRALEQASAEQDRRESLVHLFEHSETLCRAGD